MQAAAQPYKGYSINKYVVISLERATRFELATLSLGSLVFLG
jgi:hypothetical protein